MIFPKIKTLRNNRKNVLIFLFWFVFFSFFPIPKTHAARQMEMVALITDNNGKGINGDYNIRLALYSQDRTDSNSPDDQGRLWEETQNISVKDGVMRVTLGQNTELPVITSLDRLFHRNTLRGGFQREQKRFFDRSRLVRLDGCRYNAYVVLGK